ncbi:hypothetical protein ACWEN4_23295 [Streptomyces violaceorubidus]
MDSRTRRFTAADHGEPVLCVRRRRLGRLEDDAVGGYRDDTVERPGRGQHVEPPNRADSCSGHTVVQE